PPLVPYTTLFRSTIAAAGVDAAAGRRFLTLTARNDGATPCALAGSPGVRFVADVGTETDVLLEPDDAAASPVVLEPGAAASALLSWRGGSTAGGPALVVTLLVAPHPGDPETVVPLTGVPGVGDGLDLLGGGTATVGAWALAGCGWGRPPASERAAGAGGAGELAQGGRRGVPVDARVGDRLPVHETARRGLLRARHEEALHHETRDALLALGEARGDLAHDLRLAHVALARVAVRGVDDEPVLRDAT